MRAGIILFAAFLFFSLGCVQREQGNYSQPQADLLGEGGVEMKLLSNDIGQGKEMPIDFTCDGDSISPELHWEQAPAETKSFALVVSDPDAPAGTFYHWLVCNIPASAKSIPQGGPLPAGAKEIQNDYRQLSYGPPCPPSGSHRYYFRAFALDVERLECSSKQQLLQQVEQHKLAMAELMAPYARK